MKWIVDEEICSIREVENDFLVFIGSNATLLRINKPMRFKKYDTSKAHGNDIQNFAFKILEFTT